MKILVVDDDPALGKTIEKYLRAKLFDVVTAVNFIDALRVQKRFQPDLIITDYNMPEMNGIELLKEVRFNTPDVPVIMMSGVADMRTAALALREHAFDFLSKPVDLNELTKTIELALARTAESEKAEEDEQSKVIGPVAFHRSPENPGIAVLTFLRPLDQMGQLAYESALNRLEVEGKIYPLVIVCLSRVTYINNVGLNFLLDTFKRWQTQGKQVVFTELSEAVHRYLKTLGYLELFRVTASVAEAVKVLI